MWIACGISQHRHTPVCQSQGSHWNNEIILGSIDCPCIQYYPPIPHYSCQSYEYNWLLHHWILFLDQHGMQYTGVLSTNIAPGSATYNHMGILLTLHVFEAIHLLDIPMCSRQLYNYVLRQAIQVNGALNYCTFQHCYRPMHRHLMGHRQASLYWI